MANIKHLQMWNTICTDSRIRINKSLFGLRTIVTYNTTNSRIDARTIELPPADGEYLKRILDKTLENLPQTIGNFHIKPIANGNYMVEVAVSRDDKFIAVQLLQFMRMSYEPVTKVQIFEGNDAQIIAKIF